MIFLCALRQPVDAPLCPAIPSLWEMIRCVSDNLMDRHYRDEDKQGHEEAVRVNQARIQAEQDYRIAAVRAEMQRFDRPRRTT